MKHFITVFHLIFTSKIVSICVCDIPRNTGFSVWCVCQSKAFLCVITYRMANTCVFSPCQTFETECVCERVYFEAARIVNIRLVRMLSICYQREKAHLFHFSVFLLVFPSSVTFSSLFDGCFYPHREVFILPYIEGCEQACVCEGVYIKCVWNY